jgi:hypothetical protein
MTPPELEVLLHRLLWPVWQVRWEAARQLAGLIASGDAEAAQALLVWIAERRLESEAAIGLAAIEAFGLASHFTEADVSAAIGAPSHLSDVLIRRAFGVDAPRRHGFAPQPAALNAHVSAYFYEKMGQAIPPCFPLAFELLEAQWGLRFLDRWEYEWRWLQSHLDEPLSSTPHWFTWEDAHGVGHFDLRQREVYLSAFLRTLAFFASAGPLPRSVAEQVAMKVCPLDPGLAGFVYSERPSWTQDLGESVQELEILSERVWASARGGLAPDRSLLSVRAVDITQHRFMEIEIDLVATSGGWHLPDDREDQSPLGPDWLLVRDPKGGLQGPLAEYTVPAGSPFPLTVVATPENYARWHLDLFPDHLRVAAPALFHGKVAVELRAEGIGLAEDGVDVSSMRAWNTAWVPTKPKETTSRTGRTTDVRATDLKEFLSVKRLSARRLGHVRVGKRDADNHNFVVESAVVWLDPEDV